MGEMVQFASNGSTGQGYLTAPDSGSGPGVIVIQEYWGLNEQIKRVCDLVAEGFVALAPDLYRGEKAADADEAARLMMAMNIDQAARDMAGAIDFLVARPEVTSSGVGVVGFCMGGGLALWIATLRPDRVEAVAPFYGVIPWPSAQPDYSKLRAPVQGHYASDDPSASPEMVAELDEKLTRLGKRAEFFVYPNTTHAFANDDRPEVYNEDAAELAWSRTLDFFRTNLTDS